MFVKLQNVKPETKHIPSFFVYSLCDDEDYHSSDEDCWTGSHYGDYTHEVASTTAQKYNPEVPYSSATESREFPRDSRLQVLIDKLINLKNAATKAVRIRHIS